MTIPTTPGSVALRSKQHPLIIGAAVAVVLFCLVGTAAILGWIPSSVGGNSGALTDADRAALAAQMPAPSSSLAPMQAPLQAQSQAPQQLAQNDVRDQEPRYTEAAAPVAKNYCNNCGNIESIREITTRAQGSGVGAAGGAILGGLLGNQVGGGNGRSLATVAGAVGGAVVGNQVEGNMKASHSYEIHVRLDNGTQRTFHQQNPPGWRNGDRVRVVNGGLRSVN
jgi:outer membrane lipoprotein SlyB